MEFVYRVLVLLHLLGMAALFGAWLLQRREGRGRLVPLWWWSIAAQVVTGLALIGVVDGARIHGGFDASGHIKVGVKLVVLLVVGLLAVLARNRPARIPPLANVMAALVLLNLGIAVFWD
ncbi:MAG: hypothetical protein ACRDQ5_12965 [Sciscionella sp.]